MSTMPRWKDQKHLINRLLSLGPPKVEPEKRSWGLCGSGSIIERAGRNRGRKTVRSTIWAASLGLEALRAAGMLAGRLPQPSARQNRDPWLGSRHNPQGAWSPRTVAAPILPASASVERQAYQVLKTVLKLLPEQNAQVMVTVVNTGSELCMRNAVDGKGKTWDTAIARLSIRMLGKRPTQDEVPSISLLLSLSVCLSI